MSPITLPSSYDPRYVGISLQSIINYDQWDDWLPDPVYYADVVSRSREYVAEVAALRTVPSDTAHALDIYSDTGLKFRTAALPLSTRLIMSAFLIQHAQTLQESLKGARLNGFDYRAAVKESLPEWTADTFGISYNDAVGTPRASVKQPFALKSPYTRPAPLFAAAGDGLSEALDAAGVWLRERDKPVRSVVWSDVRAFSTSINRASLWSRMQAAGGTKALTDFLEALVASVGITGATGLPPIDDAWGYLGNFYLKPVDDALSSAGIIWRRCGDEYLLFTEDADQRNRALAKLSAELTKIGLVLDPKKRADVEVDDREGDSFLATEAFLLRVRIETSSRESTVLSEDSWPGMLRHALEFDMAAAPHNLLMLLLRSVHFARQSDVLNLDRGGVLTTTRGKRYRETISKMSGLPDQARTRLQQAAAANRWWTCHWLLLLISDLGERADSCLDTVAKIAQNTSADGLVRAQAALTLAKTGSLKQIMPLQTKSSGSPLGDRFLAVAAYFADKRFRRNFLEASRAWAEPNLWDFLNARLKKEKR